VLTPEEREYILARAYVPEHIPDLMVPISGAEPFLLFDYVYYLKDNLGIVVGYPLDGESSPEIFEGFVNLLMKQHNIECWRLMAPEMAQRFMEEGPERESDQYYTLRSEGFEIRGRLKGYVHGAASRLHVDRGTHISKEHEELIREFLKREKPKGRIGALFLSMHEYVESSDNALVLNGWDEKGRLAAFYVLELGAHGFAAYVTGCYSRKHYAPHASDLLFVEMVTVAREYGKDSINLGLGVDEGIRRFKTKWGGVPAIPYQTCELHTGRSRIGPLLDLLGSRL
jgi:hypothetical protein